MKHDDWVQVSKAAFDSYSSRHAKEDDARSTSLVKQQPLSNFVSKVSQVHRRPAHVARLYKEWPLPVQRAFATVYCKAAHAAALEYTKVVEEPAFMNERRNAREPASAFHMMQNGTLKLHWAKTTPIEIIDYFSMRGEAPSKLAPLLEDLNKIVLADEYKRWLGVVHETRGEMRGQGSKYFDYWVEGQMGERYFSTLFKFAARMAVVTFNVCSCERFFSISGWVDDSRSASMTDDNFKGRVMVAYNGSRAELQQRLSLPVPVPTAAPGDGKVE